MEIDTTDEIGELADAFNRVQATAAALVEQQVNSRRNVAVMFANIARRTQNLVGRQRTQMQSLRRYVTDPRATEQLSRLDQQRIQLRRTADSLLVVSGIVDQGAGGAPALLADVIAGVCADVGPEANIQVRIVVPVAVTAGFVDDLRLILGELLANAVNFSPPGNFVELSAELREDLTITVVDHGLGLTTARLEEENRRLVDRERLDVAPTTVLGLFVVGRLARRHGLAVRLAATHGGGVTALVQVPARLLGPGFGGRRDPPPGCTGNGRAACGGREPHAVRLVRAGCPDHRTSRTAAVLAATGPTHGRAVPAAPVLRAGRATAGSDTAAGRRATVVRPGEPNRLRTRKR